MLITLIYGSTATKPLSESELIEILKKARENNTKRNVTGMLLYNDGNFLQVLEGEEADVTFIYNKITQDTRHHAALVFVKQPIDHRMFGSWEMGFVDVDNLNVDKIEGYSHFIDDPEHSTKLEDASYAYAFLDVFRQSVR